MGTKYRKDLTAEDFRIVKRFKHHMHRLAINERIQLSEWTAPVAYEQNWYKSGMGWKDNGKKERKDTPCYFLTMPNFRAVVRGVSMDIDTVTEGLVIETLKRFSLILFTKENNWKWTAKDGTPVIVLERQRLSPEGTLKKRNPETASAKLAEHYKDIRETMDTKNLGYKDALESNWINGGITEEQAQNLRAEVERLTDKKKEIRAGVDERIRQRPRTNR
jgi:hypothetical protein